MRTTTASGRGLDLDVDGDVGAALAAVLDGVHRRLADGGLEALEARRREAEVGDGGRDPVHRQALVAFLARDGEGGREGRRVGGVVRHAGCPPQGDERDVVLLLPVGSGEAVEVVEQPVEQLAAGVVDGHRLAQAREAEHLLRRVVGLDEAVRVEQDVAAGGDDALGLLVADVRP